MSRSGLLPLSISGLNVVGDSRYGGCSAAAFCLVIYKPLMITLEIAFLLQHSKKFVKNMDIVYMSVINICGNSDFMNFLCMVVT